MLAIYHGADLILFIAAPVLAVIAWCVAAAATRFIPNQERNRKDRT